MLSRLIHPFPVIHKRFGFTPVSLTQYEKKDTHFLIEISIS